MAATSALQVRRLLATAREDRQAASRELSELPLADQATLVCEAPLERRAQLLELLRQPELVIPQLPVAELCFTAKAVGLHDASWILEWASPDQIVASFDLDVWQGIVPDRSALQDWLAAFAEAGEEPMLRVAHSLDPEILVLALRDRIGVVQKPDDDDGWEPPDGSQTIEGQFHVTALREGDDLAPTLKLLDTLFRRDYWLYFRLLQGTVWELESDLEEWALRWRTGRLEDLGFPSWDDAMRIYGFLRPEERTRIPDGVRALDVGDWDLPIWIPELPRTRGAEPGIFAALRELDDDERRGFFYAFVALANKVAVADGMALGDAETLPRAVEKSALTATRGLDLVAVANGLSLPDVLRRVPVERLFRVGASTEAKA